MQLHRASTPKPEARPLAALLSGTGTAVRCCQGDLWPSPAKERPEHHPESLPRAFLAQACPCLPFRAGPV